MNPEGKEARVSYTADCHGFRVLSNSLRVAPVAPNFLVWSVQVEDTPEETQPEAFPLFYLSSGCAQLVRQSHPRGLRVTPTSNLPIGYPPKARNSLWPGPLMRRDSIPRVPIYQLPQSTSTCFPLLPVAPVHEWTPSCPSQWIRTLRFLAHFVAMSGCDMI